MTSHSPFELHGIGYSPWTEKARWALRHHQVPHRYREHLLWLGMPFLSAKVGLPGEEITVPVLLGAESGPVMDSLEIARFAEKWAQEKPGFSPLFPAEHLAEIKHTNVLSELLISRFRLKLCYAVLESTEAQEAMAPSWIPDLLRPLGRPLIRQATRYVMAEFGLHKKRPRDLDSVTLQSLVGLRSALKRSGGKYLLGDRFTYADVTASVCIGGLRPIASVWDKLSPIQREIFTDSELAADFPDLIEWRDWIYSHHNPKFMNLAVKAD